MLVEKNDANFLQFRTLTVAPIDPKLVNFKILEDLTLSQNKIHESFSNLMFKKGWEE